ncbi:MAG: hypothetical protein H0V66_10175, partial [Bdellovibrionales bacterium]|nr:hypothetical protein [Bdellovibrionales bacterium]
IGSSVCGEKIYLDDVVIDPTQRDRLAAVLQNLSTTAASSGLIDVSMIPSSHTITVDLTNDGTATASISTARSTLEAAAGITLAPVVTILEARAHANSNIPAPDASLITVLNSYAATSPRIKLTKTSGDAGCWDFYSIQLDVEKFGNGYVSKAVWDTVIGSADVPMNSCTGAPEAAGECAREIMGIEGVNKVIRKDTLSYEARTKLTFGESQVTPGEIEVHFSNILTDDLYVESIPLSDGTTDREIYNINNYFPFTDYAALSMNVKFSADGSISGTVNESGVGLSLSSWTSISNYVLVKEQNFCSYSISKY